MVTTTTTVYNVFTSPSAQGNPAAVIVLPPTAPDSAVGHDQGGFPYESFPPTPELQAIAKQISLPMTAFALPLNLSSDRSQGAHYAVRWFNATNEAPLCGHATVALSEHLFRMVPDAPQTLKYLTRLHGVISASRQPNPFEEEELIAIEFPELLDLPTVPRASDRWFQLQSLFEKATSSPWEGDGQPLGVFEQNEFLLIEFSPELNLKDLEINPDELAALNNFTYMFQVSTTKTEQIHTRVVNTIRGHVNEDIATGSAHRAIVPHALSNAESKARLQKYHPDYIGSILRIAQQSKEGGELIVQWLQSDSIVRIMGRVTLVGSSTVTI